MSDRSYSLDKTRRPRNSLLAAGLLIATIAVLAGFHVTTMVLSATSLSADAERSSKRRDPPPRGEASVPAVTPRDAATVTPAVPVPPAAAAVPARATPATAAPVTATPVTAAPAPAAPDAVGIAAAAKAKAQAELDAAEESAPEEQRREPVRRRSRPPRVEMHKVY
jgi:hypothetical protein